MALHRETLAAHDLTALYYIHVTPAFMSCLVRGLVSLRVPDEKIRFEAFGGFLE
jgi:ferredoxin-NADP reductase